MRRTATTRGCAALAAQLGTSGDFGFSIAATLIVQTITLAPLMLIAANVRNLVAGGCYVLCGHRPKVA